MLQLLLILYCYVSKHNMVILIVPSTPMELNIDIAAI